jgi:hypothetical protein
MGLGDGVFGVDLRKIGSQLIPNRRGRAAQGTAADYYSSLNQLGLTSCERIGPRDLDDVHIARCN